MEIVTKSLLLIIAYGPSGTRDIMGRSGNSVPLSRNLGDVATGGISDVMFEGSVIWTGAFCEYMVLAKVTLSAKSEVYRMVTVVVLVLQYCGCHARRRDEWRSKFGSAWIDHVYIQTSLSQAGLCIVALLSVTSLTRAAGTRIVNTDGCNPGCGRC